MRYHLGVFCILNKIFFNVNYKKPNFSTVPYILLPTKLTSLHKLIYLHYYLKNIKNKNPHKIYLIDNTCMWNIIDSNGNIA